MLLKIEMEKVFLPTERSTPRCREHCQKFKRRSVTSLKFFLLVLFFLSRKKSTFPVKAKGAFTGDPFDYTAPPWQSQGCAILRAAAQRSEFTAHSRRPTGGGSLRRCAALWPLSP